MPHELIYTSAVRGLARGSDGYCTVAETPDLPKSLRGQLERLSGYRHRANGPRPDPATNPTAFSHLLASAGGERWHVLSRVADAGFDHTDRTNYLAHHLAFAAHELPAGGPAWLAQQPRVFQTDWASTRPPETLPAARPLPSADVPARRCDLWAEHTGDGGWAGELAASASARDPVAILYTPGQPVLDLLAEALALVPPDRRWQVTFNTYFTGGADCHWRFMPADSREAKAALAAGGKVLRLDRRMSGTPGGPLAAAARTGVMLGNPMAASYTPAADRPAERPAERPARPARRTRRTDEDEDEDDFVPVAAAEPAPARRPRRKAADDADTDPVPPPPARSPVGPLLVGLGFGLALAALLFVGIEAVARQSLLRMAGVKGKAEEGLEQEVEKRGKELGDEESKKLSAQNAVKEREQTITKLTEANKKLEVDLKAEQGTVTALRKDVEESKKAGTEDHKRLGKEWDEAWKNFTLAHPEHKPLLDKLKNKPGGAVFAALRGGVEALDKQVGELTTEVERLKGQLAAEVRVLPLAENKPEHLLPPDAEGRLEFNVSPLGIKGGKPAEDKGKVRLPLLNAEDKEVSAVEYDRAGGTVKLEKKSALLAGTLLKFLPPGEKSAAVYVLIAPPAPTTGAMTEKDKNTFTLDLPADLSDKTVGFRGGASVRLVGGTKKVALGPPAEAKGEPATALQGKDGDTEYTLKVEGGKLVLTLAGQKEGVKPPAMKVAWAELVPLKPTAAVPSLTPVFRIHD